MTDTVSRCACGHLVFVHGEEGCLSSVPGERSTYCPCRKTPASFVDVQPATEPMYYD